MGLAHVILMLMLLLILILLLRFVDSRIHANINCSHDANLGVPSSFCIANTTANTKCNTENNGNTSIKTSIDICRYTHSETNAIQLTKYKYNYPYNSKAFTDICTNISTKNSR